MKLYVDPINYWKDGYNLLDVVIIIIIFIPYSLRKVKGKHHPYLNIADGVQSLRILKLITYSRGVRVSGLERGGSASAGDRAPDEVALLLLSCGDGVLLCGRLIFTCFISFRPQTVLGKVLASFYR